MPEVRFRFFSAANPVGMKSRSTHTHTHTTSQVKLLMLWLSNDPTCHTETPSWHEFCRRPGLSTQVEWWRTQRWWQHVMATWIDLKVSQKHATCWCVQVTVYLTEVMLASKTYYTDGPSRNQDSRITRLPWDSIWCNIPVVSSTQESQGWKFQRKVPRSQS